jgi:hypothetical protein
VRLEGSGEVMGSGGERGERGEGGRRDQETWDGWGGGGRAGGMLGLLRVSLTHRALLPQLLHTLTRAGSVSVAGPVQGVCAGALHRSDPRWRRLNPLSLFLLLSSSSLSSSLSLSLLVLVLQALPGASSPSEASEAREAVWLWRRLCGPAKGAAGLLPLLCSV